MRISENPWIVRLQLWYLLLVGGTVQLVLEMSDEGFYRFARLRSRIADLTRRKTTYNDTAVQAIDAYYEAVMAAERGDTFALVDANGEETPYPIFEPTEKK